jgi:hypothetical protein
MLTLWANRHISGKWIRADTIVKLLQTPSYAIVNFDVASFNKAKLKNTLSWATAMSIDVLCTPNDFGIYRKIHYTNGIGICYYYFTLSKSGIPPASFSWSNVITSLSFLKQPQQQQQQQDEVLTDTDTISTIQIDNSYHVEPVKTQKTINTNTTTNLNTTSNTK